MILEKSNLSRAEYNHMLSCLKVPCNNHAPNKYDSLSFENYKYRVNVKRLNYHHSQQRHLIHSMCHLHYIIKGLLYWRVDALQRNKYIIRL